MAEQGESPRSGSSIIASAVEPTDDSLCVLEALIMRHEAAFQQAEGLVRSTDMDGHMAAAAWDVLENSFEELTSRLTILAVKVRERTVCARAVEREKSFRAHLMNAKAQLRTPPEVLAPQSAPPSTTASIVKLPRLTIPIFTGEAVEWPKYRALVESLLGTQLSLGEVERYSLLMPTVSGEAAQLISAHALAPDPYTRSWAALRERFDNPRTIDTALIRRIFDLQLRERATSSEIRTFTDRFQETINTLEARGYPVKYWDPLLAVHLLLKLPSNLAEAFEDEFREKSIPPVSVLMGFLKHKGAASDALRAHVIGRTEDVTPRSPSRSPFRTAAVQKRSPRASPGPAMASSQPRSRNPVYHSHPERRCWYCERPGHGVRGCERFKALCGSDRRAAIERLELCFNCLSLGHLLKECNSDGSCHTCGRRHHTLLHIHEPGIRRRHYARRDGKNTATEVETLAQERTPTPPVSSPLPSSSRPPARLLPPRPTASSTGHPPVFSSRVTESNAPLPPRTSHNHAPFPSLSLSSLCSPPFGSTLLATAHISIINDAGIVFVTRALLDSGSHSSIMTNSFARLLRASVQPSDRQLIGLGGSVVHRHPGITTARLRHQGDPPFLPVSFQVTTDITCPHPIERLPRAAWPHLQSLKLADPQWFLPRTVEVLLGADVLPLLLRPGIIPSRRGSPIAMNTSLGWVMFGSYRIPRAPRHVRYCKLVANNEGKTPRPKSKPRPVSSRRFEGPKPVRITHEPSQLPSSHPNTWSQRNPSSDPVNESHPSVCSDLVPLIPPEGPSEAAVVALSSPGSPNSASPADGLTQVVARLWELDQVAECSRLSVAEQACESDYVSHVARTSSGRYMVHLPLTDRRLGRSVGVALRQFQRLETRLRSQPELRRAYHAFMRDYVDSGHMTEVIPTKQSEQEPFYLPHHPVHRPDDPPDKLRVVFNASCRSANGKSLNDVLMIGPKLQADIVNLIIRFRAHQFVFTADIRQMYRQVLVTSEHRDFQRIVWRFSDDEPVAHYQLNTVTYGVSSSPFLALRTLKQLAMDEGTQFPLGAHVLNHEVYVDDILTGADSVPHLLELRRQVVEILMAGGFELRKWLSNSPQGLQGLPPDHCRALDSFESITLDRDPITKILGLRWDPHRDSFSYQVRLTPGPCTKRSMLSQAARIFDPLGWLGPVVFKAKLFIQRLWQFQLDWDETPSESVITAWQRFQNGLLCLGDISIPRYYPGLGASSVSTLVGFCDASELGFAAVVYLHTGSVDNHTRVTLLASKSRVAPLKQISLPRLELCAAHLLARLIKCVREAFQPSPIDHVLAFSDSTVALAWIAGEPYRWKTFVANRVSELQAIVPSSQWRHVASEDNPADCASRGLNPEDLREHPLWWRGPSWLQNSIDDLPSSPFFVDSSSAAVSAEARPPPTVSLVLTPDPLDLIHRFSQLSRLKRVVAWIRRFTFNCRHPSEPRRGPLRSVELSDAFNALLVLVQRATLPQEYTEALTSDSKLRLVKSLKLFVDDSDILRVGGRIPSASVAYHHRHPALLPKNHHFTDLVIDDAHLRNLHSGALATHSFIRSSMWIIDGRNVVRRRLAKCNRCFSCKPRPVLQPLGNMPSARVTAISPFHHTGVDYAGPFSVSTGRIRGARVTKAYLCAFVCFATKAVHLELASELTSACFIAAYRRFASRRGHSAVIFSDNGTNFVGAHRQLNELSRFLANDRLRDSLITVASGSGTDWRFIPPAAPHFGGLWEAVIKSTKHHLRRVMGEQVLTYEEFSTLLSQVEAILNSRPLCAVSSDPSDLQALTPGHFLAGRPLTSPPDADHSAVVMNRLSRWHLVQRLHQDFWKRWRNEYLHTLQQRSKWLLPSTPVSPGTLVLLMDELLPPSRWMLGRISAVTPGKDGIVRVVDITTSSGTLTRPIVKICPLPNQ